MDVEEHGFTYQWLMKSLGEKGFLIFVFWDNYLSTVNKAWMKLDLDGPRDRHMNFNMNQYHDPSYGFNLKEVLDKFSIKELDTPKEREKLESQLKNGDRTVITVEKNGEQVKLHVEAVPRYSQLNMFALSGRPEKREQFLKENPMHKEVTKSKGKEVSAAQGLGV